MAPASSSSRVSFSNIVTWRPTKIMHMRDLAKDDDFLSHLLVEKLGTGTVPLLVHKMDSSRRLPKTSTLDLMRIVRRLVASKGPLQQVVRHAVDELLLLPSIRYYLKSYTQKQINAFATHASRYFELYHPSGSIEIAHTSRYSHRTGKSELCILATRNLIPGTVVTELKGSMANLTDEEDKELKRTDLRNSDIRRDFSVIHSKSMKKNHLFLGPARFVNHDCDNNCELFREGRYITFRVLRPIAIGEEITAHYGDGYFGKKNRHCLCETCEKNGRGGYSPEHTDEPADPSSDSSSNSDSDSDSDSDTSSSSESESDRENPVLNVNERRTRRGVYAISKPREDDSDESDDDDDDDDGKMPLADAKDVPADGEIELTAEIDTGSDLTSLATSLPPSDGASSGKDSTPGVMTPIRNLGISRSSSSLTDLSSSSNGTPKSNQSTPFRSIISTRRQKARAAEEITDETNLSDKTLSTASVEPSPKRLTRSVSSLILSDRKDKARSSQTPCSTPSKPAKNDLSIKKEEQDSRVLRTRLPVAALEGSKDSVPKSDVPMGCDGKPLPTCSTCFNVLPLISVDSQVVWGLSLDVGKKKTNQKQECPRCIRHFAIYEQNWPSRVPAHGTSSATPREEIAPVEHRHIVRLGPKVSSRGYLEKARSFAHVEQEEKNRASKTQKVGPMCVGPKVSSAAYRAITRARDQQEISSTNIGPKVSYATYRALGCVRDEQDEEEDRPSKRQKAAQGLMSRKMRVVEQLLTRRATATRTYRARNTTEAVKRKRGRPRLSSPRPVAKTRVKVEELQVEIPVIVQPRATNGRFGKKDKSWRKSRECSGASSTIAKFIEDDDDDMEPKARMSPRHKRGIDAVEDFEEPLPKKSANKQNLDTNDIVAVEGPVQKVLPRPASGFRGGRLFSNPNPLRFALHAWAGPVILDESSSDDEKQPETPEDGLSSAADIATPEELSPPMFLPSILPRAPLTYKPSPFVFAKNRWNATLGAFSPLADNRKTSMNSALSDGNLWPIPRMSHAASEDEVPPLSGADSSSLGSMPEGYPSAVWSDDEPHLSKLRHVYPVLPTTAASMMYIPRSTTFPSQSFDPKPTFINAGWDDSSDGSEV